jgi:photoactive yellow protein
MAMIPEQLVTMAQFDTVTVADLETLEVPGLDQLPFGVIGMNPDTTVVLYNATEAKGAGLDPANVVGQPFFAAIAQCMNNFMVAQRFEDEERLDETIPYVLTLRMRPTKVRLRLLAEPDVRHKYVLIDRY